MKHLFLMTLTILLAFNGKTENDDRKAVKAKIMEFSKAADSQDTQAMTAVLHDHFRAVINRQFGNDNVSLIDKTGYLGALSAKKIGGDQRTVTVDNIEILGNTATATVKLDSESTMFNSFMTLVKDVEGQWFLISDIPNISKK